MPIAIIPVFLTNAIWGLLAGALALLVRRARPAVKAHPPEVPCLRRSDPDMRTFGIAVLGLAGGILASLVVQDVIVRLLLNDGAFPDSKPLAPLVGFLTPAAVVTGVVVALVLDRRRTRERTAENGRHRLAVPPDPARGAEGKHSRGSRPRPGCHRSKGGGGSAVVQPPLGARGCRFLTYRDYVGKRSGSRVWADAGTGAGS